MKKTIVILVAAVGLAGAGTAAASLMGTVTLRGGQSTKIGHTTVKCKAKTVTVTQTVTVTAPAPTPPPPTNFNGNGGETLAPFTIAHAATLSWTDDGGYFGIYDQNGNVLVNSQGSSGSTYLQPGSYTLEINAIGNWTITVTQQ
jgi:hypothetical protein